MMNILILRDFFSNLDWIVEFLSNLVKQEQIPCRVLLLNTYLVPKDTPLKKLVEKHDRLRKISQSKLAQDKKIISSVVRSDLLQIETISNLGSLPSVISSMIKKEKISLIAMRKSNGIVYIQDIVEN